MKKPLRPSPLPPHSSLAPSATPLWMSSRILLYCFLSIYRKDYLMTPSQILYENGNKHGLKNFSCVTFFKASARQVNSYGIAIISTVLTYGEWQFCVVWLNIERIPINKLLRWYPQSEGLAEDLGSVSKWPRHWWIDYSLYGGKLTSTTKWRVQQVVLILKDKNNKWTNIQLLYLTLNIKFYSGKCLVELFYTIREKDEV